MGIDIFIFRQLRLRTLRRLVWRPGEEVGGTIRPSAGNIIAVVGTASSVTLSGLRLEQGDWLFHTHLLFPHPSSHDKEVVQRCPFLPHLIIGPEGRGGMLYDGKAWRFLHDDTRLPLPLRHWRVIWEPPTST